MYKIRQWVLLTCPRDFNESDGIIGEFALHVAAYLLNQSTVAVIHSSMPPRFAISTLLASLTARFHSGPVALLLHPRMCGPGMCFDAQGSNFLHLFFEVKLKVYFKEAARHDADAKGGHIRLDLSHQSHDACIFLNASSLLDIVTLAYQVFLVFLG